jgi:hypothetical protein
MESAKANYFKSPAEAEHESWLAREVAQRIAGHADSRTTKLYVPPRTEGACRRHGADPLLKLALVVQSQVDIPDWKPVCNHPFQ